MSDMARSLRIQQFPDAWYHVMNRGRREESYNSVGTVIERAKQQALSDREFGKRVERIGRNLKVGQEQT